MRNMHPQGHLAGLFRVLEQEGLDKEKFILRVGLDHPFFQRRKLRVLPFVDFEAPADAPDRVQSVTVTATYEGDPQSLVFDAAHADGAEPRLGERARRQRDAAPTCR